MALTNYNILLSLMSEQRQGAQAPMGASRAKKAKVSMGVSRVGHTRAPVQQVG